MPWWWGRRRRWWAPTRRKRRKPRYHKTRRRRWTRRYRNRRAPRRRRRRRVKVRRKKKQITVKQWQPDTIRKCKIKGISIHVLGSQGKQFACYTDSAKDWTPPLQPSGGGFGVEKYTLQYLYEQNRAGNNIWTASNKLLDLVRYTGGYIKFFRHPHADFIVRYSRTLPMNLEKYTYSEAYPQNMMLARHKKYIPSLLTKPHGKRWVKIKFKPPKQLTNKWYFQETFANTGLIQITSTVADLRYPHLGCCNENLLVSFIALNLEFYKNFGWGNPNNPVIPTQTHNWYIPYNQVKIISQVKIGNQTKQITTKQTPYENTISYDQGWFQPTLMQATQITVPEETHIPTTVGRYNPARDTGVGNAIWLVSVLNSSYQPPKTDKDLILEGLPLYELLLGFTNYIQKIKKEPTFLRSYCLFLRSPAIEPQHTQYNIYCPIDASFVQGKGPFDSYVTQWQKQHWFPTVEHQMKTINAIVTSGPFMPKLDNLKQGTWELWSNYCFFFKFGGAQLPDADTANPAEQGSFPIPTNQQQTVQISNPEHSSALATIHSWDLRRGIITSKAFKRMCENQLTDTDFQTDTEPVPKKRKKEKGNALHIQEEETQEIQSCLRSLCEESSCQEFQDQTNLQQLIQHQKQQQQHIKQNLLRLIVDLKNKQKVLQLQTGILE